MKKQSRWRYVAAGAALALALSPGAAVAQKSGEVDDIVLKLPQPARFDFIESALWNYKAALPVIATVEQHEQLAVLKEAERLLRIILFL